MSAETNPPLLTAASAAPRIPLGLPLMGVGLTLCLLVYLFSGVLWVAAAAYLGFWLLLVGGVILFQPARVLLVFLWLLPIYQLSLVLLYNFTGSNLIISAVQPWKEALAFLTLALAAGHYAFFVKRIRMHTLDVAMLMFLGLSLVYTLLPWGTSLVVRLYGFRSLASLVVIYFAGRSLPLAPRRQTQIVYSLLLLGLLTGIAVLIDRFLLPIDWPARIGLGNYLGRVANLEQGASAVGPLGLPWTYWTAGMERRSSGFFANPLDLAASIHLTGVTALAVACASRWRTWRGLLAWTVFAFTLLALLLSISRMSIAVFGLECLLVTVLMRRQRLTLLFVVAGLLGFTGLMLTDFRDFVIETVTLQNPSVMGHLVDWEEGFRALLTSPFGLGPGTSGLVGARLGTQVGGENQYVTVGVQLGVFGMLLYLALQVLAVSTALRVFRRTAGVTRVLALITGVSRLGIALVAFTADLETYVFSAFVSWWLVGWVCQLTAQSSASRLKIDLIVDGEKNNP